MCLLLKGMEIKMYWTMRDFFLSLRNIKMTLIKAWPRTQTKVRTRICRLEKSCSRFYRLKALCLFLRHVRPRICWATQINILVLAPRWKRLQSWSEVVEGTSPSKYTMTFRRLTSFLWSNRKSFPSNFVKSCPLFKTSVAAHFVFCSLKHVTSRPRI